MLNPKFAMATVAARDIDKAKAFYSDTLGLTVQDDFGSGVVFDTGGGTSLVVYLRPDHEPGAATSVTINVGDVRATARALAGKGVKFEDYDTGHIKTDADHVAGGGVDGGPSMAWFTDPDGNIIAIGELM